jgi:predicted Fe-Mo cluster-binding NifX family protein
MIAFFVWHDRIAPVITAADAIVLYEKTDYRRRIPLETRGSADCISLLKREDVRSVICGAIERDMCRRFTKEGIHVFPFFSGEYSQLVESMRNMDTAPGRFIMPGCRKNCTGKMNFLQEVFMPGLDNTGPRGDGPRTGGGFGNCTPSPREGGRNALYFAGRGMRALGRGMRQRLGKNRGRWQNL